MVFKTKKISSGETIGGRLRKARHKLKLTIEQAEEKTKVRSKYLRAIETDDWKEFPSRIYVLGFVRRYSEFLELNSQEILSEFKDQFDNFSPSKKVNSLSQKSLDRPKLIITPKLIYTTLAIAAVLFVIGYMAYAIMKFSKAPTINISSPTQDIVQTKDIVIEGTTSQNAIVDINGQAANVEDDGHFVQKVQLDPGVNVFEVDAKNRLGKQTAKIVRVLYQSTETPAVEATPTVTPMLTSTP